MGEHSREMKNIFEVLKQKEDELKSLQGEVDALRIAARLLADDEPMKTPPEPAPKAVPVFRPSTPPVRAASGGYRAAWGNVPRQFP